MIRQGWTVRDPQTYAVIGAATQVHRLLGHGFLAPVYQEALALEFGVAGIAFVREAALPVFYRGLILPVVYRADFLCFERVIVELKALTALSSNESARIINELNASHLTIGLLPNFGAPKLEYRQIVLTPKNKEV